MMKKQKIVVAMSGGVDSSVVAAMLSDQGHEIIGVTMQLYDQGKIAVRKGSCCAGQDIYDAQLVAKKIGIPHYTLDYESVFKQAVIEDFVESYARGETPIPCVKCNQQVKFKDLLKFARDVDADALATGHYVRKIIDKNGSAQLHKGIDCSKDQSYFLFATKKEELDYLMFPLGHMEKSETRKLAQFYGLEVSDKPDSQDICFVPNGNYREVVREHKPGAFKHGNILDIENNIVGHHDGIINYTIGQRRGIGVAGPDPLYVIAINPKNNTITVGSKEHLKSQNVYINEMNWIDEEKLSIGQKFACEMKLRSMHKPIEGEVEYLGDGRSRAHLFEPYFGVTPGQACVMYDGSRMLGGGWIVGK